MVLEFSALASPPPAAADSAPPTWTPPGHSFSAVSQWWEVSGSSRFQLGTGVDLRSFAQEGPEVKHSGFPVINNLFQRHRHSFFFEKRKSLQHIPQGSLKITPGLLLQFLSFFQSQHHLLPEVLRGGWDNLPPASWWPWLQLGRSTSFFSTTNESGTQHHEKHIICKIVLSGGRIATKCLIRGKGRQSIWAKKWLQPLLGTPERTKITWIIYFLTSPTTVYSTVEGILRCLEGVRGVWRVSGGFWRVSGGIWRVSGGCLGCNEGL